MPEITQEFIERVEARLGMGHGAWDHLEPKAICEAILQEAVVAELEDALRNLAFAEIPGHGTRCLSCEATLENDDLLSGHDLDCPIPELLNR